MEAGTRVSRLEVFFDLVFVYGLFNIARFVTKDLTVADLTAGLLLLALLWFCWVSHVLVAQRVRLTEGYAQLVTFAAMAGVVAIALTVPRAFGDQPGGAPAPLLFPACYITIRGLHFWLHWQAAVELPGERRQIARLGVALLVSTALLFLAAVLPWYVDLFTQVWVRIGVWALAVLIEYLTGLSVGLSGWRLAAPGHFVERFELLLIVTLGESIISIGIGSGVLGRPITWPAFFSSILAVVVIASLWWAYFDIVAPAAQLVLEASQGRDRIALARDAYIYLHLPIIAGLMLLALGGEEGLRYLGSPEVDIRKPVPGLGALLVMASVALYFLGLAAFQLRALGTVLWTRVAIVLFFAALVPVAGRIPSALALGLLGAGCIGLVIAETVLLADSRRTLHQEVRREREAHAARETEWRRRHR